MRENENLTLRGERALLVPYRREHVPLYHAWMQVRPAAAACAQCTRPALVLACEWPGLRAAGQ